MKPTKQLKTKLTDLYETLGYAVRFEKGQFQGGACLLEDQRVVVINKFHPLEAQINRLIELLADVELEPNRLNAAQQRLVQTLRPQPEDARPTSS